MPNLLLQEQIHPPRRDPLAERRERWRYQMLRAVYERTRGSAEPALPGLELGEALGLSREETFRAIQFLAHQGYLHYVGAGPRVRISAKGTRYVEQDAGRRGTVRG